MKSVIALFVLTAFAVIFCTAQNSISQVEGIEGTWYFGQKPLTLEIYDKGWRFSVTDENGNKSYGKAFNEVVIYLPTENITGQLEVEASIVHWSDGTYWSREAFTGDVPPNLPED